MNIGVNIILLVVALSIPSIILLHLYLKRKSLRKELEELDKKDCIEEEPNLSEVNNRNPNMAGAPA